MFFPEKKQAEILRISAFGSLGDETKPSGEILALCA
jgi:hypothetical protein